MRFFIAWNFFQTDEKSKMCYNEKVVNPVREKRGYAVVTITDRVRFSETDLMAVVHHTNYLRWFEAGRVAYFRQAGIDLNDLQKAGYMIPIVDVQAHFKQSARFDDMYEVQTTLVKVSRITIEFRYKILRKSDGALLVEGTSRNAFVNLEGKPERLTGEYFDKLQQLAAQERENQA